MSNIIEAKGLNKQYGNFKALDNVSFELESGRILGLIEIGRAHV